MSSTYAIFPSSLVDSRGPDRMHESRIIPHHANQHHGQPSTPIGSNHLSPFSSSHLRSNSASPTFVTNTPAESVSTLSVHYQSSDYSEIGDDPFFGIDFNAAEGDSPSFLGVDHFVPFGQDEQFAVEQSYSTPDRTQDAPAAGIYQPISPDQTPSLNIFRARERGGGPTTHHGQLPQSVSPQELTTPFRPAPLPLDVGQSTHQLTPETSGSGQSSDDGIVPAPPVMPVQSPRVTVSLWGKDPAGGTFVTDDAMPPVAPPGTSADYANVRYGLSDAATAGSAGRDSEGRWLPNQSTGQQGLDPDSRPSVETDMSINELAAQRKSDERNQEVQEWLTDNDNLVHSPDPADMLREPHPSEQDDNISPREIPLGNETENKAVPGQTYFMDTGGEVTSDDIKLMREHRFWTDAPVLLPIQSDSTRHQPETAQAAIEKFERMCRDNDSILSRAATWGTRRRSLPSVLDAEGVVSGSFLKKLSISRGDNRRPSILGGVRGLLKKPSTSFKRNRSNLVENDSNESLSDRRESRDSLAPPTRTLSGGFGKRQAVPSINTALVSVSNSVAAIGTTHVRSGSISNTPITSPKSPNNLTLGVKAMMRRPRSGSELAGMWKKAGGPPVASLAKTANAPDPEDDDDDEDDLYEDMDMKHEANQIIDGIEPTFSGFRNHIQKLNPGLGGSNTTYLLDRIAHQQIIRYKSLLTARVKHLNCIATRNCPCGSMCIAQGGSANILDPKGDARSLDPLSARYEGSDGDVTPLEGAISQESFPQDIPLPPTSTLPAEFECQLCFQAKKFQKPSDWTKHVHEDVQPFTCTWDKCREPKIFKRKADWVRHENEGHRHLEWWTCDVDDCRHICYRRDNFLQHLVREHKFAEPKVKTKAAIKRAGAIDPTWQKVEKCREETPVRPQQEPCRFCGKTFPTWKKLTVHLAKHMEQISLPVLRLVARKELEADTIISPVQDPPQRPFASFPVKREHAPFNPSPNATHAPHPMNPINPYQTSQPQYVYDSLVAPQLPPPHFNEQFYGHQFESLGESLGSNHLSMRVNHGYPVSNAGYGNIPVTTSGYMPPSNPFATVAPDIVPFPALSINALGLQDLQDPTGGHVPYNHMMDPSGDQYTSQGSVSPYSHSPNQGQGGFYGHSR